MDPEFWGKSSSQRLSSVRRYFNIFLLLYTKYLIAGRNVEAHDLAMNINQPDFIYFIRQFLYEQLHTNSASTDVSNPRLPAFHERVSVYPSAVATFYAPSDICGIGGMRCERIRSVSSWRGGPSCHDCVFLETDPDAEGMRGLDIARVRLFFSFIFQGIFYPCALVQWFSHMGNGPDKDTGMWIIKPESDLDSSPNMSVIHLDTILCGAHLIGVYGKHFLPRQLSFTESLDVFRAYYVNKYIDHHSYEIAF